MDDPQRTNSTVAKPKDAKAPARIDVDVIEIVGAGPAGLAAAITLARAGRRVVVREAHTQVGHRFQGDLQGLENWTTRGDVLDELSAMNITTDFEKVPCADGTAYDDRDRPYRVRSRAPLFYLIERGPGPGTLDTALLEQAHELGVEVCFGERCHSVPGPGVLAAGPRAADAIAVGYHFETDLPDGFWLICDDRIAPDGYSYLLAMHGKGTVKSCMFSGFKDERRYVQRTVEAFRRLVGLEMRNPRPHGGVGNFRTPETARSGQHPVSGEQAGFQDALWGFGIRFAIRSGVLAARSLIERTDYDALWRRDIEPWEQTSIVNRVLYSRIGNTGYRWLLRWQAATDARTFLHWIYRPDPVRRLLRTWAHAHYRSQRRDVSCDHANCECVWCRCAGEYA